MVERLRARRVKGIHGYFAHAPAAVAELAPPAPRRPLLVHAHARDIRKVPAGELRQRACGAARVIACNDDAAGELGAWVEGGARPPRGRYPRFARRSRTRRCSTSPSRTTPRSAGRCPTTARRTNEAIAAAGIPHKLDVTVQLGDIAAFEQRVRTAVAGAAPDARTIIYGHLGDGNLHVNVLGPSRDDEVVDEAVLELVGEFGGSISAEHGVGVAKRRWLHLTRSAVEIDIMAAVKDAFDPRGILNPGVLLPDRGVERRFGVDRGAAGAGPAEEE